MFVQKFKDVCCREHDRNFYILSIFKVKATVTVITHPLNEKA